MKRFAGFILKELYHILRDPRSMLILFGMPVIQVLLFGYVITNEIKDAKIAVWDKSRDEVTTKLIHKVESSGYFLPEKMVSSSAELHEAFREGNIKLALIIEPDFSSRLEKEGVAHLQIIGDASDPNTANLLTNSLQGIVFDYLEDLNQNISVPYKINPVSRMLYNPELKGVYLFVPGIMAMLLMLVSAMMTSISITREKELGTMEILLVSPLKPIQIVVGKVIPYFLLSFINVLVILAMGHFIFGVPILGSLTLLLLESMLFILMALSLGILISTIAKDQQTAMMMSMFALMLPTILLSGFIFPLENMPEILQLISNIVPPRWYIMIIKNIMLKGTSFLYIWQETLILAVMTIVFIGLSVKKFKIRLD